MSLLQLCLPSQDLNNTKPVNIIECIQESLQISEEILTTDSLWGKWIPCY